jgi:chromosome segregation ATPase
MTSTVLDKPLDDLRREINYLRQVNVVKDDDMNKLSRIITDSHDKLRDTSTHQQQLVEQLQQLELSLSDINNILRNNHVQRSELAQQSGKTHG